MRYWPNRVSTPTQTPALKQQQQQQQRVFGFCAVWWRACVRVARVKWFHHSPEAATAQWNQCPLRAVLCSADRLPHTDASVRVSGIRRCPLLERAGIYLIPYAPYWGCSPPPFIQTVVAYTPDPKTMHVLLIWAFLPHRHPKIGEHP